MGYQRQTRQLRRDVGPNLRKGSRVRRIPIRQTVYAGIPGAVIVGVRPDQAIDLSLMSPFSTRTSPTLQILVRSLLAVSKSIATKSFIRR